jgi:hypothetical protein
MGGWGYRSADESGSPTPLNLNIKHQPPSVPFATRTISLEGDPSNRKDRGEVSTAEAETLIEELARFEVLALAFSGDEPLLRTDLGECVAGAAGSLEPACSLNERDIPGHAPRLPETMEKDVPMEKLAASNSR